MASILIWTISIVLMLVGLVGTVIPALPGMGLVFLGILVYAVATQFATIESVTVLIFGITAAAGWLASFFGSAWGARMGGGKTSALVGAIIGAIAGVALIGPPGLVVGAFGGALIGALLAGQSQEQAVKIAAYSVVGILGGAVVQFLLAVCLIVAFFIAILT